MPAATDRPQLVVRRWGSGPSVVLVHGAIAGAHASWGPLRSGLREWCLVAPNRRGYHPRTPTIQEDFEADAEEIAMLLTEPAHLVGHSYGAVVALLAAGLRPELVQSLTLVECPPLSGIHEKPIVRGWLEEMRSLRTHGPTDTSEFLACFMRLVGGPPEVDRSDQIAEQIRLLRGSRPVWTARPNYEITRDRAVPTMVVSGGHSEVFEAAADDLAGRLGARRERIDGAGHFVQKDERFAVLLHAFLSDKSMRSLDLIECSV